MCTDCKIGTYGTKHAATSSESCVLCVNGQYQDEKGSKSCKLCTIGQASPKFNKSTTVATKCLECKSGRYQAEDTSTTYGCDTCKAGQFTPVSIQSCLGCPKGQYSTKDSVRESYERNKICMVCPSFKKTNAKQDDCELNIVLIVVVFAMAPVFVFLVLLMFWYRYKVEDDYTEEYETCIHFYEDRLSRCCCCIHRPYNDWQQQPGSVEMINPVYSLDVVDVLDQAQWKIPPEQLSVGKRIGAGGCGWVYTGTLGGSGASIPIACKEVISASIDPDDLKEFQHEARMMTQLHHPCVITFYGVCEKTMLNEKTGDPEQRMYMVTELAPGGSLEDHIQKAILLKKLIRSGKVGKKTKRYIFLFWYCCWF